MFNYPVFLNLKNSSCLVVGAGAVGRRKALELLRAGAGQVVLVAPSPPDEEDELAFFPAFKRVVRAFDRQDLNGHLLVFAATNNAELNLKIAELCAGIPCACNVAGSSKAGALTAEEGLSEDVLELAQGQSGSFILPARATCAKAGDDEPALQVAICSQGQSPALVKRIAADLNALLPQAYGEHLNFMARLRPVILALNLSSQQNKQIFNFFAQKKLFNLASNSKEDWSAQTYLPRNKTELALALALVLPTFYPEQIEEMSNKFFM